MKRMFLIPLVVVCGLPMWCEPGCTPPPTNPTFDAGDAADADVATVVVKVPSCEDYCTHAAQLGCDEAKPTPGGASCVEVCTNFQAQGIAHWNMACRVKATTCPGIDACN